MAVDICGDLGICGVLIMNKKILEKIKHCLALSKSSNEHEAATALMQKYGLSEDVEALRLHSPNIKDPATWLKS